MRVFAISDLHLSINNPKPMNIFGPVWDNYLDEISAFWNENITDDDVVLIAGDISWAMTMENVVPDLEFLGGLKGKKVLLRGNHDYWWHSISALRAILPYGMYAVQNDCIRLNSLLICGSRGWAPASGKPFTDEDKKIYDREVIRLGLSLAEMEKIRREGDTVIAMTHFPPFSGTFEPSEFTAAFAAHGVRAVVYGHLHGKNAYARKKFTLDGVEYFLTSCDLVANTPVLIADLPAE